MHRSGEMISQHDDDQSSNKSESSHAIDMLQYLHECYTKQLFCDVTIQIRAKTFNAHRVVLAQTSEYFRALLQMENEDAHLITINEETVKPESFEYILQFAYTGSFDSVKTFVELNSKSLDNAELANDVVYTIQNLAIASDYLGVVPLKLVCEDYLMANVTVENTLELFVCSYLYRMPSLFEKTQNLFMKEFLILSETGEYFDIPVQLLQQFLENDYLTIYKRDFLVPPMQKEREKFIFVGVLRYASKHILGDSVSSKELAKLLKCVKLLEFDEKYMSEEIEKFPLLQESADILEVLNLAKSYSGISSESIDIPEFWKSARHIGYQFCYGCTLAIGNNVGRNEFKLFCDNEELLKPHSVLTKISLGIRSWDGRPVLGALEFTNNEGDVISAGEQNSSLEMHEIVLQPGEVITKVAASAGWMIDSLTFFTNFQNVYGPYGGDGGGNRQCTPDITSQYYLHSFKGASVRTQGKLGIVHLSFRWITFTD